MILTNILLGIGFSLVASFTNAVPVPAEAVPGRVEDLREFVVGDPHSPVDLHLLHRRGTAFNIRDGVVYMFESPGSFSGAQDSGQISRYTGTPALTSNQVVALATRTIGKLVRAPTNPIVGIAPQVLREGDALQAPDGRPSQYSGKIPFYVISWPDPDPMNPFHAHASVEVDARKGLVTRLALHNKAFLDPAFAQEISNRVCRPDPPGPDAHAKLRGTPRPSPLPRPTPGEVERAIDSWLWLCSQLAVPPGRATNLAAIDWDKTFVWTNFSLPGDPMEMTVEFTNHVSFCAVQGVAISHRAADAYFWGAERTIGDEEKASMLGTIRTRWENLGRDLERVMVDRLAISPGSLARYQLASPYMPPKAPPEPGTRGFKRVHMGWIDCKGFSPAGGFLAGFGAEFDLETGELKKIGFLDPQMIEEISRAQSRPLTLRSRSFKTTTETRPPFR